jgi:4-amino-4-deoxy-L-arabinose transferase-like glycosyltransferase
VVLLVCLPPLWVNRQRAYLRVMEDFTLASAQETWLRQRGGPGVEHDPDAWLIPTSNGRPRIRKPPLTVWLHMLCWTDIDPQAAEPDILAGRARLLAGIMLLLAMSGTYAMGVARGGRRLGILAALVLGTMWFVQREGRTAAYDIHLLAWGTLSMAAFLWFMPWFRPSARPTDRWRGVLPAGLFLACAWMSKGPLALAVTLLPLAAGILVCAPCRRRDLFLLAVMAVIAAALSMPWYLYLLEHVPGARAVLLREYRSLKEFQPVYYYLALLGMAMPWGLWLIAGVVHPFRKDRAACPDRARGQRWFPLIWFGVVFIFFSIPETKQQRYILPVVPASALLVAAFFADFNRVVLRGWRARIYRVAMHIHWGLLALLSLLLAPFLLLADRLCEAGMLKPDEFASLPVWVVIPLWAVALYLAWQGWKQQRQGHICRAAVITALWMVLSSTAAWYSYKQNETALEIEQAARLREVIHLKPVRCAVPAAGDDPFLLHWGCEKFLFYWQRYALPISLEQLKTPPCSPDMYVLAPDTDLFNSRLAAAGWNCITSFIPTRDHSANVWCHGDSVYRGDYFLKDY